MRCYNWTVKITFLVSIVSIVLVFLFGRHFCVSACSIEYDISLAVFGSSFMGFIISIIQYFTEKRKSMEVFYYEALEIIEKFGKINYFLFEGDNELIKKCLCEEYRNKVKHTPDTAKQEYINAFCKGEFLESINDEAKITLAKKQYKTDIRTAEKTMKDSMNSYIEFSQIEFHDLDNAYGNIDFIFGNKHLRNEIMYDELYSKLGMYHMDIKIISDNHFKEFLKSQNGNVPVMIDFLTDLNEKYFSVEQICDEDYSSQRIYRKDYDKLSESLEKFRCKIYGQKYTENKPTPTIILPL